jgi:hypothetical protein
MKKVFILLITISVLFLTSCASDIAANGGTVFRGEIPKPTDIASYYKNENIVYITKSGKKYHKDGCSFLKSSKIMISLEQAKQGGLTPCSKCFPDNTDK